MGRILRSCVSRPTLSQATLTLGVVVVAAGLGWSACAARASVQADTNVAGQPFEDDAIQGARSRELRSPRASASVAPPVVADPELSLGEAPASSSIAKFLGVFHDLSLKPDPARAPACTCLAVAHGAPSDSRFMWNAAVPPVDANTLAVAISGDVACDWATAQGEPAPHPSIAGVTREGGDVVLTVELAHPGRPVERGVLVERPDVGKAIVIRSKGRTPFGHPIGAQTGECRIAI